GKKSLSSPSANVEFSNVHLKVDSCIGPVWVRSYAQLTISTSQTDSTIATYGDPMPL
ncbi:MAG: MspA family porin, partial [Mycobacteriaceae bacterium]